MIELGASGATSDTTSLRVPVEHIQISVSMSICSETAFLAVLEVLWSTGDVWRTRLSELKIVWTITQAWTLAVDVQIAIFTARIVQFAWNLTKTVNNFWQSDKMSAENADLDSCWLKETAQIHLQEFQATAPRLESENVHQATKGVELIATDPWVQLAD